jgi:hypothetical protein
MCSSRHKDEFPPLLNPGLHDMGVDQLKPLVVDKFPLSTRRQMLWDNLVKMVQQLKVLKVPCKIWVDGSFLTEKINPDDIDFVVDVSVGVLDKATAAQADFLDRLSKRAFRKSDHLHSFVMFDAPSTDSRFTKSQAVHEQWKKDFGLSYVKKEPKGIAVLAVQP